MDVKRSLLYRLLRPEIAAQRARMEAMLGEFSRPGDLVFDIGANRGVYAKTFAHLGCRVVAVEPNPDLGKLIAAAAPSAVIVQAAVGAEAGTAELWVGEGDGDSTLSRDYLAVLEGEHGFQMRPLNVPVTTLDALIAEHGEPSFVKIDVEGYEPEVLAGLSRPIAALSFEFHGTLLRQLDECLRLLDGYRFRISVGTSYEWAADWGDAPASLSLATRLAADDKHLFADIYAQRLETRR